MQLELRKRLIDEGYQVGQLGTEPNALLFGLDCVYPVGYNRMVCLDEEEQIRYLNYKMNEIADGNDLIIVGHNREVCHMNIKTHHIIHMNR